MMTNQNSVITINPKKILAFLILLIAVLVTLSIYGQNIRYYGVADIRGPWHEFLIDQLIQNFYLDAEGNITTYINALLLFIPALLLLLISLWKFSVKNKYQYHWLGLSLAFLFLSFDEMTVLHESLIKPMRAIFGAEGFFYFAWVIPGMIIVGIFLFIYLFFFLNLDKKFRWLFFISLGVYIGGVIGGEMLSGYYASALGLKNLRYATIASIEESIEMIGCSLIIYFLLEYIKHYLPEGITFKLT
jgi:hypothetical protein